MDVNVKNLEGFLADISKQISTQIASMWVYWLSAKRLTQTFFVFYYVIDGIFPSCIFSGK